jgi:hypothetical protein
LAITPNTVVRTIRLSDFRRRRQRMGELTRLAWLGLAKLMAHPPAVSLAPCMVGRFLGSVDVYGRFRCERCGHHVVISRNRIRSYCGAGWQLGRRRRQSGIKRSSRRSPASPSLASFSWRDLIIAWAGPTSPSEASRRGEIPVPETSGIRGVSIQNQISPHSLHLVTRRDLIDIDGLEPPLRDEDGVSERDRGACPR